MAKALSLDMISLGGYSNTPKSNPSGKMRAGPVNEKGQEIDLRTGLPRKKVKVNPAILAIVEKHFGRKKKKVAALLQAPAK